MTPTVDESVSVTSILLCVIVLLSVCLSTKRPHLKEVITGVRTAATFCLTTGPWAGYQHLNSKQPADIWNSLGWKFSSAEWNLHIFKEWLHNVNQNCRDSAIVFENVKKGYSNQSRTLNIEVIKVGIRCNKRKHAPFHKQIVHCCWLFKHALKSFLLQDCSCLFAQRSGWSSFLSRLINRLTFISTLIKKKL